MLKRPLTAAATPAPAPAPQKLNFDLRQAHRHVPASVVKLLWAQLKPLAEDTLPEPQDLGPFWERIKRALFSLDEIFNASELAMRCG